MYIKSLSLTDWKSHKSTKFTFGKINLIRGSNNVGKSSVAEAIEYLLTGRCDSTDDAGRGGDALIRAGSKRASVEATIGGNHELTLQRERNHAGTSVIASYNGRQYVGRQFDEFMAKWGYSRDVMSAAMRGSRFLSLPPGAQKELLADVLRPEAAKVPPEIQEAMGQCFAGFVLEEIDLDGARELEERATKLRAECTAALRELGEPEKVEERPKGAPTSAEVEKKLGSLRAEMMALTREKERIENDWATRCERRRAVPAEIAALEKRILSEADEKKYLEAIEHEGETNRAAQELRKVNLQIEDLEHQIKTANAKAGKCPTCGHETDTEELTKRFQDSVAALRSRIPGLAATADKYPHASESHVSLAGHREAVVSVEKLRKELADLRDFKPDVLPDTKAHQEKIEELEARIQKGQTVLSGIVAHAERLSAFAAARDKRAELESRRASADALAKYCGSGGVQAQMSSGKIGPFTDSINATLGKFGYACQFSLDPYGIEVARAGVPFLTGIDSLSESEAWRFSLAFQVALAKASGLNLVCLDRCDVLVGANRSTLLQTVLSCELEQVFLMASVDTKVKLPDSVCVFDLELNERGETEVTQ